MLKGRMAVGWGAELPRPSRSRAEGSTVIQEAAAWSGRGGTHPKPLQIQRFSPFYRGLQRFRVRPAPTCSQSAEGVWWWRASRHVPYPSPEATATRGHLAAEPVSGGGGCLAFL